MRALTHLILSNLLSFLFASVVLAANPFPGATPNPVLMQGAYLFKLSSCNQCHTSDPAKPLAGGVQISTPFGNFITPNISPNKRTGIGNWTDKEFLQALRKGISPHGQYYYPAFPYQNFSKMTDQDILAIKAFIMIQPSYAQTNPPAKLTWPYSDRPLLKIWQGFFFQSVDDQNDTNFQTAAGPYQDITNHDAVWNRGAYLVEGPLHCTECHTPRGNLGGLDTSKWMGGAPLVGSKIPAPNITRDPSTGLKDWSVQDWTNLLVDGVDKDGDKVGGDMGELVTHATSKLKADDLNAVITYLRWLPPVKNVPSGVPVHTPGQTTTQQK